VTFDLDLDLQHILGAGKLETIICEFGGDPAICPEALCANVYKRTGGRRTMAYSSFHLGMS